MHRINSREEEHTRRCLLLSGGGLLTGAWLAAHWPAIAAAHVHAGQMAAGASPAGFEFLNPAEAADIDAIAAQIVPGGASPGARDAHAVQFMDRALATFFADRAAMFRLGLSDFQAAFRATGTAAAAFAEADPAEQIAFLETQDHGEFFDLVRSLTVLGMFSSPKYGGNFAGAGWRLLGFEDRHVYAPPFGYYDRDYAGFESQTGKW